MNFEYRLKIQNSFEDRIPYFWKTKVLLTLVTFLEVPPTVNLSNINDI